MGLCNLIKAAFGEYAAEVKMLKIIEEDARVNRGADAPESLIMNLRNRRMIFGDEVKKDSVLQSEKLKNYLCSNDPVTARDLNARVAPFTQTFLFALATNFDVVVTGFDADNDQGDITRRAIRIDFNKTIKAKPTEEEIEAGVIPALPADQMSEFKRKNAVVLLAILVDYGGDVHKINQRPPSVEESTQAWFDDCTKLREKEEWWKPDELERFWQKLEETFEDVGSKEEATPVKEVKEIVWGTNESHDESLIKAVWPRAWDRSFKVTQQMYKKLMQQKYQEVQHGGPSGTDHVWKHKDENKFLTRA